MRPEDAGEYVCESAKDEGQSSKVDLIVLESRAYSDFETRTAAKEVQLVKRPGEQAELVCTGITNGFVSSESVVMDWFDSLGKVNSLNPKIALSYKIINSE